MDLAENVYLYIKNSCIKKEQNKIHPNHVLFSEIRKEFNITQEVLYPIIYQLYIDKKIIAGKTLNDNWVK